MTPDGQLAYWDSTGVAKSFTHPLDVTWLRGLPSTARIVDYGCGYGRVTGLLREHGFTAVEGVDPSPGLLARARRTHPGLVFSLLVDPPHLPFPDGGVDAVLVFAVLTCIPADDDQRRLIAELTRVLRPGGLLYVSDVLLQTDARNQDRYRRGAEHYGTNGVFDVGDGAVCRHHSPEHLRGLLTGYELVAERELTVETMNGNPVGALQLLARKGR